MAAVTPWSMTSAWWKQESTRLVVVLLTALAALDSGYTALWISQHGLLGEANPLIRSLFQASLGEVWLVGNVLATFLGAVFLGSCVVTLQGESRAYPVLGMSVLAALKVVLGLYHLIQFYDIIGLGWILWITAVVTFLATRQLLNKGRLFDLERASRGLHELRSELSTYIIMSRAHKTRPNAEARIKPIRASAITNTGNHASVLRNWRLFFWVGVIILAPILGLSFVQLLLETSGVLELPRWMRGLGMVSQEQGRLFFLSLISILLTIAILIYSIVAVFEILSGETRRKKLKRRRNSRNVFLGILMLSTVLLLASASLSAALATQLRTRSAGESFTSSSPKREIVAAADSKGRIHAAWVERSDPSDGQSAMSLWYSKYDPETTLGRTARLIDNSISISSLGITIDEFDNAHMVWVRQFANAGETADLTRNVERGQSFKEVTYIAIGTSGTPLGPPSLLLDSRADSVWASIASGSQSQLFIAWTEVLRNSSDDVESTTHYTSWGTNDRGIESDPTLVTKMRGSSRMLKATAANDRGSLHLAWIQEFIEGWSSIMYSRVDLRRYAATTVNVQEVNGTVGRLALRSSNEGEVLMGWIYQERNQGVHAARTAKLSSEGRVESIGVEVRPRYSAEPESMIIDSQGNLHLLWMDLTDGIRDTSQVIRANQLSFYHVKFTSNGEPGEEKQEVSYLPAIAVFLAENGDPYVISPGGVLEPARSLRTIGIMPILLVFVIIVSLVSGFRTEAGVYFVTRYTSKRPWWRKRRLANSPVDLDTRLASKIRRHPGISLSDLRAVVRVSTPLLAVHLLALEASGIVHSSREGARRRFYCLSLAGNDMSRVDRLRRSILGLVEDKPGIAEAEIAKHFGISQQLANYHLRLLTDARLLSAAKGRGKVGYFVNKPAVACLRLTRQVS